MVEKMKKYSFLIYYKTYNEFLETLQQAGVVHIVEKQKGIPDDATDLRKQLSAADALKNTIRVLERRLDEQKDVATKPLDASADGLKALYEFERLKAHDEQLKAQQQSLQKEIEQMKVWGDFDPEMLKKLEHAGRQLKFYSCREREFKPEWTEKFDVVEIARAGAVIYFVTVTPVGFADEPDAEKMRISERSLGDLQAALIENQNMMKETDRQFDVLAAEHINNLKETQRKLLENIDLNKVQLHIEKKADAKLILLEGWVPEIKEAELAKALETHDVYYEGTTPPKDDATAPILLKNNRFARLFETIGELYDFPNYHELDLTPFFAPFYMLFFGLCLGDAGYGLLILTGALIARYKLKPSMKPILTLAAILGAATVVCGIIGGTLFGIQLLNMQWQWLTSFKKFMLNSDQMFNLALILGGVQIVFGMIVKAFGRIRRYGFAYSLETWGWLILILGGGSLYLTFGAAMFSHDTARFLCYGVLGVAGAFIFLFNTPGRNPLINVGSGLWNTYNMVTGVLGDLLSYIRLFALGICGGVMGFVFNDLAMKMSGDIPVLSQIIMLIILLAGHSLNIFMSGLGAFVHPMRLTFVEFYKNAGFEGGGKKYKPLKLLKSE
jgi:V/A-type H+-transporting ATPase subunit I